MPHQRDGENLTVSPLASADKSRYNRDGKSLRSAVRALEKQAKEALKNEIEEVRETKARAQARVATGDSPASGEAAGDVQGRSDQGLPGALPQDDSDEVKKFDQSAIPAAPPFYSRLQQVIEQKMGNSATVEQVRALQAHSLDITPELREAALNQGFSLFQSSQTRQMQTEFPMPEAVSVIRDDRETVPDVQEARAATIDRLSGRSVVNTHTNLNIKFSKTGLKHAAQTLASLENRIAYLNIDRLIENAIFGGREESKDGGKEPVLIFYAPLNHKDKTIYVSIRVKQNRQGVSPGYGRSSACR